MTLLLGLLLVFAAATATAIVNAADAVVLSPTGGEVLQAGSTFQVRWSAPSAAEPQRLLSAP